MSNKLEQRERQMCYNCMHFHVKESKKSTKYECLKWDNTMVGAMWCKFWKQLKPAELINELKK